MVFQLETRSVLKPTSRSSDKEDFPDSLAYHVVSERPLAVLRQTAVKETSVAFNDANVQEIIKGILYSVEDALALNKTIKPGDGNQNKYKLVYAMLTTEHEHKNSMETVS